MNNNRRKQITALSEQLSTIKDELENLMSEEQDYYDNMPEGIQAGEKGDKSEEALGEMQSAIDGIDDVISSLENSVQ